MAGLYFSFKSTDSAADYILPYSGLSVALKYLVVNTKKNDKPLYGDISKYCLAMIIQGFVLLLLNIYFDYAKSVGHRRKDLVEED